MTSSKAESHDGFSTVQSADSNIRHTAVLSEDARSKILSQIRALKEAARAEKHGGDLRFKVLMGTREIERLME